MISAADVGLQRAVVVGQLGEGVRTVERHDATFLPVDLGTSFDPVEIFNGFFDPGGAFDVLARAGHILAGITWIGLLYFFNFVQVPAYAELSDGARCEALRKMTFRALWWFRWAALATSCSASSSSPCRR